MPPVPRRVLLIVNPAARAASGRERRALAAFARAGVQCTAIHSRYAGHATQLAADHAATADAVFTLGGDGTAMEVVTALAGSPTPVGILPGGTANVLARSLGIPLRIERAVPALLGAAVAQVDLGRLADGRTFAIGAGMGLDATMVGGATPALKRRAGALAYAIAALRAFARFERFTVRLTVDGAITEHQVASVLVANLGTVVHDLISFGDGILRDDGLLDVCLFSPRTRLDALRILWRMLRHGWRGEPCMTWYAGRHIRVESFPPRAAQADGELLGTAPLDVQVLPGAGRLLLPTRAVARARATVAAPRALDQSELMSHGTA